jgi:hypothetical protein
MNFGIITTAQLAIDIAIIAVILGLLVIRAMGNKSTFFYRLLLVAFVISIATLIIATSMGFDHIALFAIVSSISIGVITLIPVFGYIIVLLLALA